MTSGERIPSRVSVGERLSAMPTAQQLNSDDQYDTTLLRYAPSDDPDAPLVITDRGAFTRADSEEFRQRYLLPEESISTSSGQWMSASEMEEYVRAAEAEALAEIQKETEKAQRREFSLRYRDAGSHIKLDITEGPTGNKIDSILAALSGQSLRPAQSQLPLRVSAMPALEAAHYPVRDELSAPAYGATDSLIEEIPSVVQDAVSVDLFNPATYDASPERSSGSMSKKTKQRIAAFAIFGSAFFWYGHALDVGYEVGRQGINGELVSPGEFFQVLRGEEMHRPEEGKK